MSGALDRATGPGTDGVSDAESAAIVNRFPALPWRFDDDAVVWGADDYAVAASDPENERDGKIQARIGLLVAASPEMLDIIEAAIPHLERQQQALQNLSRLVPGLQLAREHVAELAERADRLGELVARARTVVAAARGVE